MLSWCKDVSVFLALCDVNPLMTSKFPLTEASDADVFVDLNFDKLLNQQYIISGDFEMPWRPSDVTVMKKSAYMWSYARCNAMAYSVVLCMKFLLIGVRMISIGELKDC